MTETKEYKNPLIEFDNTDITGEGHWIDGKFYTAEEWEMRVILTRRIKPFPNGSIVRNKTYGNILQKLENQWFSAKLNRPDQPWITSGISERYIREHPEEFHILYEPGVAK